MRTIAVVSLACLLGACAAPQNQRTSIGSGRLGDGSLEVELSSVSGGATRVALTDDGVALTGLDRSSWSRTVVLIPNDHTEHHVHGVSLRSWGGRDYAGGAFPTLDTALGAEPDGGGLLAEWLFWPLKLVRDDVIALGQLGDADLGVIRSPHYDAYERSGE